MAPLPQTSIAWPLWYSHVASMTKDSRGQEHRAGPYEQKDVNLKYRQLQIDKNSQLYKEWNLDDVSSTLKYTLEAIGEKPSTGYPLYIALHGGGQESDSTKQNRYWKAMSEYYKGAIGSDPKRAKDGSNAGIYIAPRGIGDVWNLHSRGMNFILIERLIENMIMFEGANPDRVYLLGFSAGGDGVYQNSTRLSQRFAAVNASAGHGNGVNLENLCDVPICLQVGERDGPPNHPTSHNQDCIQNALKLDKLQGTTFSANDKPLYVHELFVHAWSPPPEDISKDDKDFWAHNGWEPWGLLSNSSRPTSTIIDNYKQWYETHDFQNNPDQGDTSGALTTNTKEKNTNAVDWVYQYTRSPTPATVVWDLTTRATVSFAIGSDGKSKELFTTKNHWLDIGSHTIDEIGKRIEAHLLPENNAILVVEAKRYLRILLRPDMLDLKNEISVSVCGQLLAVQLPAVENEHVVRETLGRNDPNLIFTADIILEEDSHGRWRASSTLSGFKARM